MSELQDAHLARPARKRGDDPALLAHKVGVAAAPEPSGEHPGTLGQWLRKQRQARGIDLAVLAAALKVPLQKLEALEADRLEDLPEAAFVRSLVMSLCRQLRVSPEPIQSLLPKLDFAKLEQVGKSLNAPFREHHLGPSNLTAPLRASSRFKVSALVFFAALTMLVAVAAVYFYPRYRSAASTAKTITTPLQAAATLAEKPALSLSSSLQIQVQAPMQVDVVDAKGQSLIARELGAGDEVELDGAPPLRVKLGNVSAAQVSWRGQPVDLSAYAPGQPAEFELH
jgi:cytoskeleton protein RodZ